MYQSRVTEWDERNDIDDPDTRMDSSMAAEVEQFNR